MKYALLGFATVVLIVFFAIIIRPSTERAAEGAASCSVATDSVVLVEEVRLLRAQSSEPTMATRWTTGEFMHQIDTPHKLAEAPEEWLERHFATGDVAFDVAKQRSR